VFLDTEDRAELMSTSFHTSMLSYNAGRIEPYLNIIS
jgi:hypothetical protein